MREIVDAGLVRAGTPLRFGGHDVEFETLHDITIELARACGSTAWCFQLWALHAYWMGFWPIEAQEEVFADGPDMLSASAVLSVQSSYERVSGGYRVSGHGRFASGSDPSQWLFAVAFGAEGPLQFLVPRSQFKVIDGSWDVAGLCGSGSKDVVVEGGFIPAHRAIRPVPPIDYAPQGHRLPYEDHPQRRYTVPLVALQGWDFPAVGIGLAQGAFDEIAERMRGTSGSVKSADSPVIQAQIAQSAVELNVARLLLHDDLEDAQMKGEQAKSIAPIDYARYMSHRSYAHELAIEVVNRMYALGGGRSLSRKDPLQRMHRDANATSHPGPFGQFPLAAQPYGRVLLGLDPSDVNFWTGPPLGLPASAPSDKPRRGPVTVPDKPRMSPEQAWEAIALPMPQPAQAAEQQCFSSEQARREFYAGRPPFGDRFMPGWMQMRQREFTEVLLRKAELAPGRRVLVLGEFLDEVGFVDMVGDAVQPDGKAEYVEMVPMIEAHHVGRFTPYTEIAGGFVPGQFDAVIASQWEHLLDPGAELKALSQLVSPGGKLVLFHPGPTAATFALAEQDAWLDALLSFFITFAGVREVPLAHAYQWKRAAWLANSVEDIRDAAARCLAEVTVWQHRGMAIVDGRTCEPGERP